MLKAGLAVFASSALFAATKRMLVRRTAVNTAWASLQSFVAVRLLRNGLTNAAVIKCSTTAGFAGLRTQVNLDVPWHDRVPVGARSLGQIL